MKIRTVLSALLFLSTSAFAGQITTGEQAQKSYEQLNKYEYTSGAATGNLIYTMTVRNDGVISCQKEETQYLNSATVEIEYTCTTIEKKTAKKAEADIRSSKAFVESCPEEYLTYLDKAEGGPGLIALAQMSRLLILIDQKVGLVPTVQLKNKE